MIRAFAPGIKMQDPLAQTSSNFDVRHEPTAGAADPVASGPSESNRPAPEAESEFARLEQLLSARTRERRELAVELERRGALLRDACTRLSELAPRAAESQLRNERDGAVARAVEAEVARAEAMFKLDEVVGQLLALGGQRPPDSQPTAAREPTLASRLLELDELKQMADARVLLLEHELAHERGRMASAVRERVEGIEHFEFELSQARGESSAARQMLAEAERASGAVRAELELLRAELDGARSATHDAENESAVLRSQLESERATLRDEASSARGSLQTELETERALRLDSDSELTALRADLANERAQLNAISERERDALATAGAELQRVRGELQHARDALVGELDGLRFRMIEAETALRGNAERLGRAQHQVRELEHKLHAARAERANESARVEALLVRLQEAVHARAADQEQLRALRMEREQSAAAPMLEDLRAELTRERAARAALITQLTAAASDQPNDAARAYATQQMRLEALRACLLELRLPLVEFESGLERIAQGEGLGPVSAEPLDQDLVSALEEQLRARELRIQELESALNERERPERAASRELSTLKGELIDVRANAARLSDDLAKERARRRKMAVTVRALQAATDSGEAPGPWIEELVAVVNEGGSSLPPRS
jgi:chromosome segregation ATPase